MWHILTPVKTFWLPNLGSRRRGNIDFIKKMSFCLASTSIFGEYQEAINKFSKCQFHQGFAPLQGKIIEEGRQHLFHQKRILGNHHLHLLPHLHLLLHLHPHHHLILIHFGFSLSSLYCCHLSVNEWHYCCNILGWLLFQSFPEEQFSSHFSAIFPQLSPLTPLVHNFGPHLGGFMGDSLSPASWSSCQRSREHCHQNGSWAHAAQSPVFVSSSSVFLKLNRPYLFLLLFVFLTVYSHGPNHISVLSYHILVSLSSEKVVSRNSPILSSSKFSAKPYPSAPLHWHEQFWQSGDFYSWKTFTGGKWVKVYLCIWDFYSW